MRLLVRKRLVLMMSVVSSDDRESVYIYVCVMHGYGVRCFHYGFRAVCIYYTMALGLESRLASIMVERAPII